MPSGRVLPLPPTPRILLVRLRQLGDAVVSLPVLSALKSAFPGAGVDWVMEEALRPIVEMHPDVRRVIAFDRAWDKLSLPARLRRYAEFFRVLRRERYDVVIDLMNNPRSILIAQLARAGARIGFRKAHNLFFSYRLRPAPEKKHTAARLLELLTPLGCTAASPVPDLPVPQSLRLALLARYGLEKKGYVVVCPGTNDRLGRAWGRDRFAAVALALARDGLRVLVVCGPREKEMVPFFRDRVSAGPAGGVRVLDNELALPELAALISGAALFLGTNSGPLLIAGAVHTPAVGIYGPSSPDSWAVLGAEAEHFFRRVGCNPCRRNRCALAPCRAFEAVEEEEVLSAARRLLKQQAV